MGQAYQEINMKLLLTSLVVFFTIFTNGCDSSSVPTDAGLLDADVLPETSKSVEATVEASPSSVPVASSSPVSSASAAPSASSAVPTSSK